jgi:hypothetical protein
LEAVFSMLSMLRLHNKDAGEDQQQFTWPDPKVIIALKFKFCSMFNTNV